MAPLVAEGRLGRGWSSLGYGAVEKAVEKEALPSRRNGPMCSTKKGGWMRFLLEDSVDVSCSFEAVRERFVGEEAWFAQLASAAEDEGEALLKIGPSWASGRVAREVRVTLGPPRDRGVTLVLPISWQSSELPGLFPVLEGEVELLALRFRPLPRLSLCFLCTPFRAARGLPRPGLVAPRRLVDLTFLPRALGRES